MNRAAHSITNDSGQAETTAPDATPDRSAAVAPRSAPPPPSVPLGLIANELLSNNIKYAYPPDTKGRIRLELTDTPTGELQLSVRDWAMGKIDGHLRGTGFGTQLVQLLTRQLNGILEEFNHHGLRMVLRFPV